MSELVFDGRSLQMAGSFLVRSRNKLKEAEDLLDEGHYPESVSASQECIELSMKSMFIILTGNSPREHNFPREEYERAIVRVPEELRDLIFSELYFYSSFWASFYTRAKYGLENVRLGPEKLFEKEEAQLALKHADRCKFAAKQLENYARQRLTKSNERRY